MDFNLSENQIMIAQMLRDFAEKEIKPFMKQWDDDEYFPIDTMKKLGDLGLLGIFIPDPCHYNALFCRGKENQYDRNFTYKTA